MEPGHNIALIDHRSSVNGSQFSDFQSQVDTGFDGAFLDDDFMSAISSLKGEWTCADTSAFGIGFPTSTTGNHMLPSTSTAANMELHTPVPVRTAVEYNTTPPDMLTFLLPPTSGITLASSALHTLHYVICDPAVFANGINYTNESLQNTFPKASACIRDASILAKQRLTTHGMQQSSFRTACKDFIIEMITVAKHAGHSVEKGRHERERYFSSFDHLLTGIQCQITKKTISLDMTCKQVIDIICFGPIGVVLTWLMYTYRYTTRDTNS